MSLRSLSRVSSPLCIPLTLEGFFRPIMFLLSEGSSGLQVTTVLRADNPCFHSWGWLIVQPPVLSSLTDFFPWDSKEVCHPYQGRFGVI
jgi:hypothetical protein